MTAIAALSVAVNTPATTPTTTIRMAASAQMERAHCLMKPLRLKAAP